MTKSGKSTHVANSVGHFDVAGPDLPALSRFYSTVLQWKIERRGPGYAMVTTPVGSPSGALVESQDASLTIAVVVPDLDGALKSAVGAGGKVVMPATDNGWVRKGQVSDPAGNLLTLIQG